MTTSPGTPAPPPPAPKRPPLAIDRHQLLILVLGSIMAGSFVLLVFWPKQRRLHVLGSAVKQERERVERKLMTSQTGLYMTARIPELRKAQGTLDRRLPADPEVAVLLQAVSACFEAEPAVRYDVEQAASRTDGPAPAVPLRLRAAGPFPAVYRCLASVERLERLCRFRRTQVQREPDGTVTAEAEVLAYFLPDGGAEETGPRADAAEGPGT